MRHMNPADLVLEQKVRSLQLLRETHRQEINGKSTDKKNATTVKIHIGVMNVESIHYTIWIK